MQIIQSLIMNDMYTIFSLLLGTLIVHLIIKNLKFEYYEIKLENIKYSAIISLIVVSIIIIIMSPLVLIFIKIFIVNQLKISSNSGIGAIIYINIAIFEIAPVIIIVVLRKESLYSLGITKKNILKSIFIGFTSYIIYFTFMLIVKHRLKYVFPINSLFSMWAFFSCICTAFGEEILFRGYIQNRLIEWLGDKKGLIITALFFCFSHVFQRMLVNNNSIPNAIISSISLLPVGLFQGYLFLKCKNVTASTIFHTFYNFFVNYI